MRAEKPAEFGAIRRLIETAFRTAKVTDGHEQDFAERLRRSKGYIPSLALVAEAKGELAGHIMLTRFPASRAPGAEVPLLLAAPLCVAPPYRSQGIGAALMTEALRRARAAQFEAVLLVGDPAYYQRFGFRESASYGLRNTDGIPDRYVLLLALTDDVWKGVEGTVTFKGM